MQNPRRRRRHDTSPSSEKTTLIMNLTLFIMLLTFFIALNAMSSVKIERSEPILRSLDASFSRQPDQDRGMPSVISDAANSVNEGDVYERIDALFQAQVLSYKKAISSNRGEMILSLPLEKFSSAIMAAGQKDLTKMTTVRDPQGNFMVPTLVSIIESEKTNAPYRMNIVFHTVENPAKAQNQNPKKTEDLMRRASEMASTLEAAGFPQHLLNIGLQQGDESIVELIFTPHQPFSPIDNSTQKGNKL